VNKPRLKDFIQMNQTNPPITADGAGFVRTRLPSFKGHDESEETLEKIKQFKADNQLSSDGKRNRTASLDL
jgi:hypothetical protein